MTKTYPKLYKDTMTTDEVIDAVGTIGSKIAAKKWLERNKISAYPIDARTNVWDRAQVMKRLSCDK